jgi:tetratricopeptide (TPR) repeat protein
VTAITTITTAITTRTTATTTGSGDALASAFLTLDRLSRGAVCAALAWAPLVFGARGIVPLAILQALTLVGLAAWLLHAARSGGLEWRRTALDLPLALVVALVAAQLALGNGALVRWALAPAGSAGTTTVPAPLFTIGTVSAARTLRSLLLLLTCIAVYVLVVNVFTRRHHLDHLVRTLLVLGAVLALFGLLDYLGREAGFIPWRREIGRVTGTFWNPDHFGAWLNLLVCLGLGYLLARVRSRRRSHAPASGRLVAFNTTIRRSFPAISVAVMVLALVFTLSRGALLSLVVGLCAVLAVAGALGVVRRSLALVGGVLVVVSAYAAWIGVVPLITRLHEGPAALDFRLFLSRTALPLLADFPLLGTGLGTFGDAYFRYQPLAMEPERVFDDAAHNDLLQVAIELGPLGAAIFAFAVWRVLRDLVGAHLLGHARCPVGGGEGSWARRRDPFSVGVGLGAIGALVTLAAHSLLDFAARVPANGVLAAACAGIATVALHTRFGPDGGPLIERWRLALPDRTTVRSCAAALIVALAGLGLAWLARDGLRHGRTPAAPEPLAAVMVTLPAEAKHPAATGETLLDRATRVWNEGRDTDGSVIASGELRRRAALDLLGDGIAAFEAALRIVPSNPHLHHRLAWAYAALSHVDTASESRHAAAAMTHIQRAIALHPENPVLYRSAVALVASQPQPAIDVALGAARKLLERDPQALSDLVYQMMLLPITADEWVRLAPETTADRLALAGELEARGLVREARRVAEAAVPLASAAEQPLARWVLARVLVRDGRARDAIAAIDAARTVDPDNPELDLARGDALAVADDADALAAYRLALAKAEARARTTASEPPFPAVTSPRLRALLGAQAGGLGVTRYRRALAGHLTARGLWEQALPEWDQVLQDAPSDAGAHHGRAQVVEAFGKTPEAIDGYRRAVALDATNARARLALARALWSTDQYYQAIAEWKAVQQAEPGNVESTLALGAAYLRIGDKMAAFEQYRRAVQLDPHNAEARRVLVRFGWIP